MGGLEKKKWGKCGRGKRMGCGVASFSALVIAINIHVSLPWIKGIIFFPLFFRHFKKFKAFSNLLRPYVVQVVSGKFIASPNN